MNCAKCGTRLNCVDTRTTDNNMTRRRLSCPKCNEVYHSTEKIDLTNRQERSITRELLRAKAKEKAAEKAQCAESYDQYKQKIVEETIRTLAESAIAKNVYTSYITGAVYYSEEEALTDTINELHKIYKSSINRRTTNE